MDFLKVAVIILFIISTIITIRIHPEIHQPMLIEDADFKLTRISDTLETVPKSIVASKPSSTTKAVTSQKNINVQPVKITQETKPVQHTTQKIKTETVKIQPTQQDQSQLELLQKIIQNTEQSERPIELVKTEQKPIQKSIEHPKQTVKEIKVESQTTHKNPYMTEQEEILAWNKWRSNIHNEIMSNSRGADTAPIGTAFMFTFLVDKFGNVSNIKVECSNPNFMDLTRNSVKPAIANLHRKPILQFPKGTQRTSTVVTGVFIIGTQDRYSTPSDFSDFERIIH